MGHRPTWGSLVPKQLRVSDDVAAALERAIERDGSGRSLSAEADVWLRRALGIRSGARAPQSVLASAHAPRAGATAAGCVHPVNRRLGEHCGQCGNRVSKPTSARR